MQRFRMSQQTRARALQLAARVSMQSSRDCSSSPCPQHSMASAAAAAAALLRKKATDPVCKCKDAVVHR